MNEKVDRYYDLAYGDNEKAGHKDRMFILHNLEEIEAYYEDCMRAGSGAQQEGLTEQQIIKEAIEKLSEKISVQAIGKATINTPTTAKKKVEQVEQGEKTRDNIKEGEELGNDN